VRTQALYGGSGSAKLGESWSLAADLVTVRHRTIEGVEPGRSRTAVKGSLHGVVAGIEANADAFHMAPDMATTLTPYALSGRKGGSAGIARDAANWRFFGGFRRERAGRCGMLLGARRPLEFRRQAEPQSGELRHARVHPDPPRRGDPLA
jgi:hypothetical protein